MNERTDRPGRHTRPTIRQRFAAHRAADKALQDNSAAEMAAGIDYETPEFHRLNDQAWATRDALPWWLRLVIP